MSSALASGAPVGTAPLVRLAARRDRVMVPIWLAVLVLVCVSSAASVQSLYDSGAERVRAAEAINASPGIVALYGPIRDVHSIGELAMTKMTVLYAVFVAIMMMFVVRRHTRADEETGQAELVAGTAITSDAPLAAAVVFGAAVSVVLGLLAALGNAVSGLDALGSLAFGASWAGTALVAVGLTAVACQLSSSARTCTGIASSAIGVLFVLRAVGDTTEASWLSWLSPFGWNTELQAYGDTRWWVLLLYVATTLALVSAARVLRSRRDLSSGMIAPRPGPATGTRRLADAIALSLRVHTPMIVGWSAAMAVTGLVFGAITPSFDAFDSGDIRKLMERIGGAGAFRDALLGAVISMFAIIVSCFAIAVINHGGNDEHDGRTEQVLATATSRTRAFLATTLVALLASTWLLLVSGVTIALGVGNGSDHSFGRLVASSLAQAPAVWVVTGLAVLVFAVRSRWAVAGWGIVIVFATLGQIGELLGLPDWALDLSPYSHAPRMPLEDFETVPALVLTLIALALVAAAWQRYRTRDIG